MHAYTPSPSPPPPQLHTGGRSRPHSAGHSVNSGTSLCWHCTASFQLRCDRYSFTHPFNQSCSVCKVFKPQPGPTHWFHARHSGIQGARRSFLSNSTPESLAFSRPARPTACISSDWLLQSSPPLLLSLQVLSACVGVCRWQGSILSSWCHRSALRRLLPSCPGSSRSHPPPLFPPSLLTLSVPA